MAKKLYVPVKTGQQTLSKEAKKIYVPVKSGNAYLSKIAKKAYCSVNGVSKLFWGGELPTIQPFWFYYKTLSGQFMSTQLQSKTYSKVNNGIAFYTAILYRNGNQYGYSPLLISTDPNAVTFTTSAGQTHSAEGPITHSWHEWYWAGRDVQAISDQYIDSLGLTPNCWLNGSPRAKVYDFYNGWTEAVNDFFTHVYGNDLAENYQVNQRYNLVVGDINKLVRKFVPIYLYMNYYERRPEQLVSYNNVCAHVDDIANYFTQQAGNYNTVYLFSDYPSGDYNGISFYAYYGNDNLQNILIDDIDDDIDGYVRCTSDYETEISFYKAATMNFKSDGTITTYNREISSTDMVVIGPNGSSDYMQWGNIGLHFQGT